MKTLTLYTFKGEPNEFCRKVSMGITKIGKVSGFRFDKKGFLEVYSNDPYIEKLKARYPYTSKEYKLVEIKEEAPKKTPAKKPAPKSGDKT